MARQTWIWCRKQQKLIPIEEYQKEQPVVNRAHNVITDTMDPLFHHADGKMYDSKSEFSKTTKAHGCVEYGHEQLPTSAPKMASKGLKEDLNKAYDVLKTGDRNIIEAFARGEK